MELAVIPLSPHDTVPPSPAYQDTVPPRYKLNAPRPTAILRLHATLTTSPSGQDTTVPHHYDRHHFTRYQATITTSVSIPPLLHHDIPHTLHCLLGCCLATSPPHHDTGPLDNYPPRHFTTPLSHPVIGPMPHCSTTTLRFHITDHPPTVSPCHGPSCHCLNATLRFHALPTRPLSRPVTGPLRHCPTAILRLHASRASLSH